MEQINREDFPVTREEIQDLAGRERRQVAEIVHTWLTERLHDPDIDWNRAYELKDLFDCRVCANHVAQVYEKGLISAKDNLFDMRGLFTSAEAEELERRLHLRWNLSPSGLQPCRQLSIPQPGARIIDVRSAEQYKRGHLQGAENIPLIRILENPYLVSKDKNEAIWFTCDEGEQSRMAAEALQEIGFLRVQYGKLVEETRE